MLHLQALAQQDKQRFRVTVTERLPPYIAAPCDLEVVCDVVCQGDLYFLELQINGTLRTLCQRCAGEFELPYSAQTRIAICPTEARAEELWSQHDCVVAEKGQVNLEDLVVDELHLSVTALHPDLNQCTT